MTVKSALKGGLLVALLGVALQAQAATILMNFDGVTPHAEVDQFYNGGTDGAGAVGVNYGVVYHDLVAIDGPYGQTSQSNLAYNGAPLAVGDVAAGFSSLAFTSGAFSTAYMDVYAGLGGTGTLLGSVQLGSNPHAFSPTSVSFSGVAQSFVLRGGAGQAGIDDVQITTVPEPESYGMLLAGLGLIGVAARRKQRG